MMMPSDNEKPHKKFSGPKFSQSGPIGSVFRFGKRRVSETSQPWSRSASESSANSLASWNERTQSDSCIPQGEYPASSTGGDSPGSYSPQPDVRLVTTRRPSEADSNAVSMRGREALDVNTAIDVQGPMVQSPESMFPRPPTPSRRTRSDASPPRTSTPIPSSRLHWNQLRNAIVPGTSAPSSVRSFIPDVISPVSSFAPPPRPQTPKPSRFARLGFRQVVEQTREVAHNEVSKFEAEVYQACATARFGDARAKVEREGSQSMLLPFMSTTSLPQSITASQTNKYSQSSDSLPRAAPSLKQLHQTLMRYASTSTPIGTTTQLPLESDVLSVLLIPFTTETGFQVEERWLAVETFEVAVNTWGISSRQREVDRVLWCCKAGCIPASPVRSRILATLRNLLSSSKPIENADPLSLQNILQGLHTLLYAFSGDKQKSDADINIIRELCAHASGGRFGQLDVKEIEQEYGAEWCSQDSEESVRVQIVTEAAVRCMQIGSESQRRWILHELVDAYWPLYSGPSTVLRKAIVARRLSTFLRSSLCLLRSDTARANSQILDSDAKDSDANIILQLFQHKALAELELLPLPRHALDGRALAVELLLDLLSVDVQGLRQRVIQLICKWSDDADGWKGCMETAVRFLIEKGDWSHLTRALHAVATRLPDDKRKYIISVVLPALHMRLVMDPPPYPLPPLTSLFQALVELYPQQFYKPLFSLAGASKDPTFVGHLHVVTALARHLPDFWIRDPEMMSVALMSDAGIAIRKEKLKEGQPLTWSKTRIGQSLIIMELIRCVKGLTKQKKDPTSPPDGSQARAYRFVAALETRLAILLDEKEKSAFVPFSHRLLLSILFLEIRLFSRSLKPAPWLRRIVIWAAQSYPGANLQSMDNPFAERHESPELIVGDEIRDEVLATAGKIQSIYIACWQSHPSNSRRSTMLLSASFDPSSPGGLVELPAAAEPIKEREELMTYLSTTVTSATLQLLVAVCALLSQSDYRTLGPVLWSQFLDEADSRIVAPACFLLTYCLEKSPKDTTSLIERDRNSSDNVIRLTSVRRLMTLYAWRSQLLSQTYIHDRARRRPFKLARQPIGFVAMDVGSPNYVHEQTEEDRKNIPSGALPFELRKQLAEVGWEQEELPTDVRLETVRAPISLFPVTQMDHTRTTREQATISTSHGADSAKQLLRRKSSASGYHPGAKRRPVFVPALVSLFSSVSILTADADPVVGSAAREAILLMLRDDPGMLCRPVMDTLSGDLAHIGDAISVLRAFLHIHSRLPPSASHHIFSHLGGFLKYISRNSDTDPKALRAFSYTAPILSKLITQVSNLSIRDLRRSKFEIYVFPTGSLWFPSTAPQSTMFPQMLGPIVGPLDELPSQLAAICMVRTAQNMLLFDMLKHKPQEVHMVRKTLTGLVLPGENTEELDARSFLPRRSLNEKRHRTGYQQVSLALSRSHLLLLGQVFRTMSRNFSNKAELARLFNALNKILLVHGSDIGIVTHALIACMIGATRFKRFISSSRGFSLFMPGILKVYAEAEHQSGIQHAIQYASSRFYAIHEEAYLFQSLDLASSILVRLDHSKDQDWFARRVWRLFSALKGPQRGIPDAAAIRDCNRTEEREALITATVTDQTPQTITQELPDGEQLKNILASGQYDDKLLQLDDLARLFLTVIAHDHTILRSQNFLTLFRYMAPEFYNGTKSAREVLREGISALGLALFVKAPRQKFFENNQGRQLQHNVVDSLAHESEDNVSVFDNPSTPCDHVVMRREYLNLVLTFTQMGGDLGKGTIRRTLDLVKGLLKESTHPDLEFEGTFLYKLTKSFFSRLDITVKYAVTLLQDVAPLIRAFALSINCSGVLDTVTELLKRPELANDVGFVQFVVDQIAGPAIEACESAASANLLMSLPMRASVVSLVCRTTTIGNVDVVGIIEKQTPSPGFLAGIVLPLCLTIKRSGEDVGERQWQTSERPEQHDVTFLRLLSYSMDACRAVTEVENGRSSPLPALHRRDSEKSKQSSVPIRQVPLATLAVVVQIIKVIVIRTGDDLSTRLPGLWARLARFLRQLLDDGNARFALRSLSSPTPPWHSPQLGMSPSSPDRRTSSDGHISPSSSTRVSSPRVVDYLTWSLLEFLCCAPSPLTLQMRLWMQEKVHNLDAELKAREVPGPYLGRASRRVSSSVFARVRGSSTSPETLQASHGLLKTPSELNLSVSPTTDINPHSRFSSPGSLQPGWTGPRIVHLGPTKDHQMFQPVERSSSLDAHLKSLARHTYIEHRSLVQKTRDRIRLVQTCMGYTRLLPVESQGNETNEITLAAWTRTSALLMLAEEAKLIMEEFSESFRDTPGSDCVDVPSNLALEETWESSP